MAWKYAKDARDYNRAWRDANPEKVRAQKRREHLKSRYGLTESEFNTILTQQNGKCAICLEDPDRRGMAIDHCHKTGKIRGLLCHHCNSVLGHARESLRVLSRAVSYLQNQGIK